MQIVFTCRNVMVGAALVVAGYYGYRSFVADVQAMDVPQLIRSHRDSPPARRIVIKRRILATYSRSKDYQRVLGYLDSPSPVTQALAVAILAAKSEERAIPRLLAMLDDGRRDGIVKEQLAEAMGSLEVREAIPRLIELTDKAEPLETRTAAHNALQALTGVGAQVKFSDAAREHWGLWWRDHQATVR